ADRGASARLRPADLPDRLDAPAVLVSGYTLLGRRTGAAGRAALARAAGPWVAVDAGAAALVASVGSARALAACRGASMLLASADEALALTGLGPEQALAALAP